MYHQIAKVNANSFELSEGESESQKTRMPESQKTRMPESQKARKRVFQAEGSSSEILPRSFGDNIGKQTDK